MTTKQQKYVDGNGDHPVTQTEFTSAMGAIKKDMDEIRVLADKGHQETLAHFDIVAQWHQETLAHFAIVDKRHQEILAHFAIVDKRHQEILDHFDVVAENIHLDVAGANADQIDLISDKQKDHEERITTLEHQAGLRP